MKKVTTSLVEIVGNLEYSTPGARVEYKDSDLNGPGNKAFWNGIANCLETKWSWLGIDPKINANASKNKENASIVGVGIGIGIIKMVLFDEEIKSGWSARICRIVMANGKVVEWDGETKAKKWIVECYLKALSDQLIRVSAHNAALLDYKLNNAAILDYDLNTACG